MWLLLAYPGYCFLLRKQTQLPRQLQLPLQFQRQTLQFQQQMPPFVNTALRLAIEGKPFLFRTLRIIIDMMNITHYNAL